MGQLADTRQILYTEEIPVRQLINQTSATGKEIVYTRISVFFVLGAGLFIECEFTGVTKSYSRFTQKQSDEDKLFVLE